MTNLGQTLGMCRPPVRVEASSAPPCRYRGGMPDPSSPAPIRVAVVNDHEVVVAGVAAMLAGDDRVRVVELASRVPVLSEVDVVLYDLYARARVAEQQAGRLISSLSVPVVLFGWQLDDVLVEEALSAGARGCVPKSATAAELVDVLTRVHAGEVVVRLEAVAEESADDHGEERALPGSRQLQWPGKAEGLSARESEIIALITQGLTNEDIAARAHLSINSVKTYIRTSYRKMGVERRSQAVLWGVQHGFAPEAARRIG